MTTAVRSGKPAGIASSPVADRLGAPFVGLVWLAMFIGALWFVTVYGSRYVPWSDDWDGIVPYYSGERPITADWLWSAHNEHRLVLPRLALLGVLKMSGGDLRVVMYLNVILLAALALAMIRVAYLIRGRMSFADALFPLALLNLSQFENLLNAWQLQMIMSVSLSGVLFCLVVYRPVNWSPAVAGVAGLCLVSLPVCGINGLVLALPLALWFVFVVLQGASQIGWTRPVLLIAATACLALIGLYFVGYERGFWAPRTSPTIQEGARAGLQTLGLAVGVEPALSLWPYLAGALFALVVVTAVALVHRFWIFPQDRARISGILVFLAASVMLAFGIGWSRVGLGPPFPTVSRYVTLIAPVLCIVYFAWGTIGGPMASMLQWGLFLLVLATAWVNIRESKTAAWNEIRRSTIDFEKALEDRPSIPALAKRHPFAEWNTWYSDQIEMRLRGLHAGRIGPYQPLPEHLPSLPLGARVDFSQSPPEFLILRTGWYEPDQFRWTTARAELRFWLDSIQSLRFRMSAIAPHDQPLVVVLNNQELKTIALPGGRGSH